MKYLASMIVLAALLQASALAQAPASQPATQPASQPAEEKVDFSKLYTISKETTWVTGDVPLTEDGRVNYVEWLRRHYSKGVTRDNNAAVLIVEALGPEMFDEDVRAESLKRLGFDESPKAPGWVGWDDYAVEHSAASQTPSDIRAVAREPLERAMAGPWAAEDFARIAGWLERNDDALDTLVDASSRSHLYFPIVSPDDPETVVSVPIPSFSLLREASEALVARAMLRTCVGDLEAAWADLAAVSRLARLLTRDRSLIAHLVSFSMATNGARGQGVFLQYVDVEPQQLRKWLAELQSLPRRADVVSTMDIEHRLFCLDAVMTVMHAANSVSEVEVRPDAFNWDRMLRKFNEASDLIVAGLRPGTPEAKAEIANELEAMFEWIEEYSIEDASDTEDILSEIGKKWRLMLLPAEQVRNEMTDHVTASLLRILFPSLNRLMGLAAACDSHDDLAVLVAALETHKAATGKYPTELGELVKVLLLKELPTDPFSEDAAESYIYKLTDEGYTLYGRGHDWDDDGGKEANPADENDEGDIVFSRPAEEE